MNQAFDVTTIIFAALALFVVWKLRSVLGTRDGHHQERRPGPDAERGRPGDNVVRLPGAANDSRQPRETGQPAISRDWSGIAERGSKVWTGLDEIAVQEPEFDARQFLDGAKAAYEMIILAFANGDRNTLRDLLAKDVYDSFVQAISEREAAGHRVETTFVSLDEAKITDAHARGKTAQVTVSLDSKLISATYDRNNQLVDGNPDKVTEVGDVWTFARELASRDPNWKLVAT